MHGQYAILLPYFRGNLAMAAGRVEEARAIFEQALAYARFHAPIWLNHDLARCLAMLGDGDGARAAMERSQEAREHFRCLVCGCQADGVAAEFYCRRHRPCGDPDSGAAGPGAPGPARRGGR